MNRTAEALEINRLTERRTFLGMNIAAAAATPVMANAPKPTIDPAESAPRPFLDAALSPLDGRANFENEVNVELLAFWKAVAADGVLLFGITRKGQSFSFAERKRILENVSRNWYGHYFIVRTRTLNIASNPSYGIDWQQTGEMPIPIHAPSPA
jgi:hypothetical protein